MTSKELVISTLEFRNTSLRVPRQLWTLPWANEHCPEMIQKLDKDFEWDFSGPETAYAQLPKTSGDPYAVGEYVDEWGCVFTNIQRGVIGEVKETVSVGWDAFLFLVVMLTINVGMVNLLPLPALDGGRLFFMLIELIRGKPVNPKYEGYVHAAGLVLLMGLMIFITYNDIVRIFFK